MRNQSLDALRGLAILAMVLSGSIAFGGVLPAWMYHAQVPPPLHKFNPELPGITWVDLVFPFFLFSMGAALPLALRRFEAVPNAHLQVLWNGVRRFALLAFFAFFTYHMRAWVISETPEAKHYALSMLAFALLMLQFFEPNELRQQRFWMIAKWASFAISLCLLAWLPFNAGTGFSVEKVDIIILVLANMALAGTVVWWLTRRTVWARVFVLAFVAAVFLGAKVEGSWNEWLFKLTPASWLYKFYFLKYLFIIIPGMFAGEWMLSEKTEPAALKGLPALGLRWLPLLLLGVNLWGLFARELGVNLGLSLLICGALGFAVQGQAFSRKCWQAGTGLLLVGLAFEAVEGGIKKDPSNYSYYFVTSGLAFFVLILFASWQQAKFLQGLTSYFALNGRNPMVAYVAGNLLVTPLLHITGFIEYFNLLNANAWLGFVKGLLFTGLVSLVTIAFVKRGWFWKT